MSHLRPKHLCGGAAKAPEQVGKELSGALTSCVNTTIAPLPLNVKIVLDP